ncbi:sigma-54-dependent Fis family transcriptional regulator [Psychromonas marina]|uniref:Sigma-54-dependent Fis family transcriptional regulator n=1 Tax=Psychromonas marina TaxID=88364 RepID=A0ABQ6DW95_9GAMM|nr:sigma-54 dependent transcriptional regulator [Psychromonas marina]GLS89411.1 sigma-54-dependent Fis family transcriptional regulator [Psychromonas marina]
MSQGRLLVVEDDAGLREALVDTLLLAGYHCDEVDSGEAALIILNQQNFDMVISDIQMGGMSGLTLLQNIKAKYPTLPVLLMTAYATINDAVNAIRDGAIDYLAKPFSPQVLMSQVSRYVAVHKVESCTPIYGDSSTEKMFKMASKVALSDASVMITGPSGSGKEVLSRFLHDQSARSEEAFIAINCGAIPDSMLESTLFGYEKGAFTGAVQACPGKFEQAQNGTILLDEITEMPLDLQVKLLRVLQEREVERLGSRKTIKLNIRVLATSNRDLKKAVDDGTFREDLYYRLNVFPLQWLPLNKRKGDILPLAEHLLSRHALAQHQPIPILTEQAKSLLLAYPWPGNVRELDNVMQRALILSDGQKIDVSVLILEDIQFEHICEAQQIVEQHVEEVKIEAMIEPAALGKGLKVQEQKIILEALQSCSGKRKDVAELLGISPRTLRYKIARMKEQGIALPV